MALSLAVAGLNAQQKAALAESLRAKANDLSATWTIYWEADEYPAVPDALMYYIYNNSAITQRKKLKDKASQIIAIQNNSDSRPSEESLFVRMPFNSEELVRALNVVAKKIKLQSKWHESVRQPNIQEHVELQFSFTGANRVNKLSLYIYALYQEADKASFYKIKSKNSNWELWCFPDIESYWFNGTEDELWAASSDELVVYRSPGKAQALEEKRMALGNSNDLIWQAGVRSYKTAELLPFFGTKARFHLKRYPIVPQWARSELCLRVLLLLNRKDMDLAEVLTIIGAGRKEVCQTLNALIMTGCVVRAKEPYWQCNELSSLEPEEEIFYRSLCLKLQEA